MIRLKGWIFKQNPISAGGIQLSNEKRAPGCFGYIGDYTTQLCIGAIVTHKKGSRKDPY